SQAFRSGSQASSHQKLQVDSDGKGFGSRSSASTYGDSGIDGGSSSGSSVEYGGRKSQPIPSSDQAAAEDGAFSPELGKAFRECLKPCLDAIDCLRAQGLQRDIRLPAIAVVGDQSVGKSSVLEAISGVELPRGTGIVTRCPLMLSMRSRDEPGWSARIKYQTKSGQNQEKNLNTSPEIGQAIREAQNEMTSSPGEISEHIIELWVESPEAPDLTLIDLPGIARFSADSGYAVAGITKSLIMSYIQKPEVIILVVIPCHVDIETVEALSLAKEVDPESKRTIGVLTCPDLVNPGSESEVLALMQNRKIKLKKGYVSVRCRTPQQLKDNMSLQQAAREEEVFFRTHRHFRALDKFEYGTKTLAVKLSSELYDAIKHNIPELMREIQVKREDICKQLESIGEGPPAHNDEMKGLLARMLNKFATDFANVSTGTHRHEPDRLFGRCRKHWETLADEIEQCAFSDRSDVTAMWEAAKKDIEEQRGCELPGFDNVYPVVERLVRNHFLKLVREPCSNFLVSVNQEVDETMRTLADLVFGDYPTFNQFIKEVCEGIRTGQVDLAREQIKNIFTEEEFVFTQDRIFLLEKDKPYNEKLRLQHRKPESGGKSGEASISSEKPAATMQDIVERNTQRVLEGAEAYIRVAVRRLQDTITLAVMHYMLHKMSEKLRESLIVLVTEPQPLFDKLREENPLISAKRRHLADQDGEVGSC
uniref:Dynamin-type G domain-containing protein n=1 Tax=Macrostomum lignano TaxID=282301 RepID=A0A1I8G129_9PLAT